MKANWESPILTIELIGSTSSGISQTTSETTAYHPYS